MFGNADNRKREYILPKKILWQSENNTVINSDELLYDKPIQPTLNSKSVCTLQNNGAVLLDFGVEIHGGIKLVSQDCGEKIARLRIRFGESASEAMSNFGEKGSCNDHAIRDTETTVSFMGSAEIGTTGFRFVRIDLLGEDTYISIKSVHAIFVYHDIEYKGEFRCNDEQLNRIWKTGAYTVHLNMQEYLWDGIKRDRLVWVGDMHPETSAIQTVFGFDDCVPKSLDLIRDETPADCWMNGSEMDVWYDTQATWKLTEVDTSWEGLPAAVQTAFKGGEYAAWKLEDIDMLEYPEQPIQYVIEVENGNQEYQLFYDQDGNVLDKRDVSGDKDDTHWPVSKL